MDPVLAELAERNGVPPLWPREPGFTTLLRLVLEQQVSLASADAAYRKLEDAMGVVEPAPFLEFDDEELKAIGFSRQKAGYVRGLASGLIDGSIGPRSACRPSRRGSGLALDRRSVASGRGRLPATCCSRCVAPTCGRRATERSKCRSVASTNCRVPRPSEAANERALAWRPFRAVAARLLWHEYLGGRG